MGKTQARSDAVGSLSFFFENLRLALWGGCRTFTVELPSSACAGSNDRRPHSGQLCSAQAFTYFAVDKHLPPKTVRRGFRRAFGALPSWKRRNERLDPECSFRQIFFTGSPAIGKQIMHAAAETSPISHSSWEGKSPALSPLMRTSNEPHSELPGENASTLGRPAWRPTTSSFTKASPMLFADELATYLLQYYGKRILQCDYYPHMINEHHFNRVCGLIDNHGPKTRIAFGGGRDRSTLRSEPTILTGVTLDDPVMKENIWTSNPHHHMERA